MAMRRSFWKTPKLKKYSTVSSIIKRWSIAYNNVFRKKNGVLQKTTKDIVIDIPVFIKFIWPSNSISGPFGRWAKLLSTTQGGSFALSLLILNVKQKVVNTTFSGFLSNPTEYRTSVYHSVAADTLSTRPLIVGSIYRNCLKYLTYIHMYKRWSALSQPEPKRLHQIDRRWLIRHN